MHRTRPGRPALRRLGRSPAPSPHSSPPPRSAAGVAPTGAPGRTHRRRRERDRPRRGPLSKTLVPPTSVTLGSAARVDKDGVAADACKGSERRRGRFSSRAAATGTAASRRASGGYLVSSIDGLTFPFDRRRPTGRSGLTTRPPAQGVCGITPWPPATASSSSPTATAKMPAQRRRARCEGAGPHDQGRASGEGHGHRLQRFEGDRRSPKARGATVTGDGVSAKTAAGGTARLTFTKPGRVPILLSR